MTTMETIRSTRKTLWNVFPARVWYQILHDADNQAKVSCSEINPIFEQMLLEQSLSSLLSLQNVSFTHGFIQKSLHIEKQLWRYKTRYKLKELRDFIRDIVNKKLADENAKVLKNGSPLTWGVVKKRLDTKKEIIQQQLQNKLKILREFLSHSFSTHEDFTADETQFLENVWKYNLEVIDDLEKARHGNLKLPLPSVSIHQSKPESLFLKILPHIAPNLELDDLRNCGLVSTKCSTFVKSYLDKPLIRPSLSSDILLNPWLSPKTLGNWPILDASGSQTNITKSLEQIIKIQGNQSTKKSLSIVVAKVEPELLYWLINRLAKVENNVKHLKLTFTESAIIGPQEYLKVCSLVLDTFQNLKSLLIENLMHTKCSTVGETNYSFENTLSNLPPVDTLALHSQSSTYAIDEKLATLFRFQLKRLVIKPGDICPYWIEHFKNTESLEVIKLAPPMTQGYLQNYYPNLKSLCLNLDPEFHEGDFLNLLEFYSSSLTTIEIKINKNVHKFSLSLMFQNNRTVFNAIKKVVLVFDYVDPVSFDFLLFFPNLEELSLRYKKVHRELPYFGHKVGNGLGSRTEKLPFEYIRLRVYLTHTKEPSKLKTTNIWQLFKVLQKLEIVEDDPKNCKTFTRNKKFNTSSIYF